MTPEALWSFEFVDNKEHHGGGVAVFYKNQVLGGNNGFTYIGEYLLKEHEISIKVNIKRFKDDVKEVAAGYECGIGIEGFMDIQNGDIMEIYKIEEVQPQSLEG